MSFPNDFNGAYDAKEAPFDLSEDRPMAFALDWEEDPQDTAKQLVAEKYNRDIRDIGLDPLLRVEELRVVWFAKTLQNWKAILVTTRRDSFLFELTHNGDTQETYVQKYGMISSETIAESDR